MKIEGVNDSWKETLRLLNDMVVDDVTLIFEDEETIRFEVMDESHTTMIRGVLAKGKEREVEIKEFEEDEEEDKYQLGVDVNELYTAIKSYGRSPDLDITIEDQKIHIESNSNSYSHEITLPEIEPMIEEMPEPELNYEDAINFEAELSKVINRAEKIIEKEKDFRFTTEDGKVYIHHSNDNNTFKEEIEDEVENELEKKTSFAKDLLSNLKKEWEITMESELPLIAERTSSTYDSDGWKAELKVVIAPRVETE